MLRSSCRQTPSIMEFMAMCFLWVGGMAGWDNPRCLSDSQFCITPHHALENQISKSLIQIPTTLFASLQFVFRLHPLRNL